MKYYDGYVVTQNEQPEYLSEPMICESVEDYVDRIVWLLNDVAEPNDREAEDIIIQKLLAHEFETETVTEDGDEYVTLYVRV